MNNTQPTLSYKELQETWPLLSPDEQLEVFKLLAQADAADFFLSLTTRDQATLLLTLPERERRLWIRALAPDAAADVIQEALPKERDGILALLDETTRTEVMALLAYAEDAAGGLMNPRFARVRPEMSVNEAVSYLRRQARERIETIYYVYVLLRRFGFDPASASAPFVATLVDVTELIIYFTVASLILHGLLLYNSSDKNQAAIAP